MILPHLRASINALAVKKFLAFIKTLYTYFQAYFISFKTFKWTDTPKSSCERLFLLNSPFLLETSPVALASKFILGSKILNIPTT